MKKVTLLALALGFGLLSYAQDSTTPNNQTEKDSTRKYRSWSIGADFGWSLLFGDMHQLETNKEDYYSDFGGFDPGFTLNLQKWYSSAWGWRGRAGWLSYSGTKDAYAVKATSTFRGDMSVQLNLSGIGQRNRNKPDRKDAWIVSAGVGYTWSDAIVYKEGKEFLKLGNDNFNEFDFGNAKAREEKSHNSVYMPFGLEWRYRFAERWDLKIAADFIWSMDDNFDGSETAVKEDWPNTGGTPPTSDVVELAFGNTTNDFLGYFNVGVNYHFAWFSPADDKTPIIYVGPGLDPRVDKLVDDMDKIMTDKDNDGVSDYFDKEPDTPEGYMVYGGGQAVDQDKDGVADDIDEDPYSTKGAKVDANGREYDEDGDGVYDAIDKEPNTEKGKMVNFQGVAITHPTPDGGGAFLPMIYFDFDKATVTNANYERLATVARFLNANPNVKLNVYGHTDKVGGEQYNNKLSDRRAAAAKNALINDFGISADRFVEVKGEGKSQLWSKRDGVNRRVEFQVAK